MQEKNNPISEQSEPLPNPPVAQENRFDFLSFVHGYVWGSIQYAEQKAGFVFAANTAFLGYVVTTIPANFSRIEWPDQLLILAAVVFLLISIVIVVSVVSPHLAGNSKGLIYFGAVSSRKSAADYSSDVFRAGRSELDSAVADHIFEMAKICDRKQRRIRWAIRAGLVGFVAGLLWLTILHMKAVGSDHAVDFWSH